MVKLRILIILIVIITTGADAWEVYDRVIATVNETPIIESEVVREYNRQAKIKQVSAKKHSEEKSRILDKYIEDVLVKQQADMESIIVSDMKVDDQIKKMMANNGVSSLEDFKNMMMAKEKMSFEQFREEMRKSIITEQVMSIAIGVSPPTTEEAKVWYEKNKSEMGFEINYSHILVRMKADTFEENKQANNKIKKIQERFTKGESFEKLAVELSEDIVTRAKGGAMGWTPVADIARQDIIYANNIYKLFIIDKKKSGIVKSNRGYHLVKLSEKRPTSFEAVKNNIFNVLYQQKMAEQFKKWIYQRRHESDIKIFMQDYTQG